LKSEKQAKSDNKNNNNRNSNKVKVSEMIMNENLAILLSQTEPKEAKELSSGVVSGE